MHNSMILFLINDSARAVKVQYDPDDSRAKLGTFKTMDPTIQVDDMVVVQSGTRYEMTVARVVEVDVDIDYDASTDIKWVVQRIDAEAFKEVQTHERTAITTVQTAERDRKRKELRAAMFDNHMDAINTLQIASGEAVEEAKASKDD